MKILRNRVKCLNCNTIIESCHRHDFVACRCFKDAIDTKGVAVDGGKDYLRRLGDPNNYQELSEYYEED